jgi:hypothetical protein
MGQARGVVELFTTVIELSTTENTEDTEEDEENLFFL